jgi:hypothetical protein
MLIGLTGRKEVGKDTTFNRIHHMLHEEMTVERVGFADFIYRVTAAALGCSVNDLHRWKVNPNITVQVIEETTPDILETRHELTVRELLQNEGQGHRVIFGAHFWEAQVADTIYNHQGMLLVVTDVRLESEAKMIIDAGGYIARVSGDQEDHWDRHETEQPIPSKMVEFHVNNSKREDDFAHLDNQVEQLIGWLKRKQIEEGK